MSNEVKTCSNCDALFASDEGYREDYCCRSCYRKEYRKNYYKNNKEKIEEVRKRYYRKNKAKISERNKQYAKNNREKLNQIGKRYYWNNKAKISERAKEKRKKQREQIKQELERQKREQFKHTLLRLDLHKYQNSYQEAWFLFQEIFENIAGNEAVKLRRTKELLPALIYLFLKLKGENISIHTYSKKLDLLFGLPEINIFKKELRYIKRLSGQYRFRDRKAIILKKLTNLMDTFVFDKYFFTAMIQILDAYWSQIKETTDDVATGTICALALIKWNHPSLTIQTFCKELGIAQSAVLYQIKNKILKNKVKSEFKTVTESKSLIINALEQKIGSI